jgi:hypothetical protein
VTDDELAIFADGLSTALRTGRAVLLTPLPRHIRLRLWAARRVDSAAICLVEAGHDRAAVLLWRASGMWHDR